MDFDAGQTPEKGSYPTDMVLNYGPLFSYNTLQTPFSRRHRMASADTVELSDSTFEDEVIKSETPVLVDFWASWCGPCRMVAPVVEDIAKSYAGRLKVGKVNVDENQEITMKYGIRSIPTLILFKNGKAVDQIIGAVPKSEIERVLKKTL
jgi:thioredoxin 1